LKKREKLNCRHKERLQASTTMGKEWDEKSEPAYSETKASTIQARHTSRQIKRFTRHYDLSTARLINGIWLSG